MYCVKRINDDLFWVGGTDRRLALFENAILFRGGYPIMLTCCWMRRLCC